MRESYIEKYNLKEIDIIIARKIRERRLELGLSQEEVAKRMHVTRGNITHFEMGRNKIRHDKLAELAKVLGKPVGYFLTESTEYDENEKLKSNPEEIKRILEKWKMKNFLEEKKVSQEFLNDLALSVEYLCELHGEDFENIW